MRQLLYISSSVPRGATIDIRTIVAQSCRNNLACGVTGLLYSDGLRFLQVLEGAEAAITATFARIAADRRHGALVVLHDRLIEQREFGDWAMLARDANADADRFDDRMRAALATCSPQVRGTFEGLIAARRAA